MLMQKLRSIGINASKRILKIKKSICGGIITGTDKIRSGFGNGDCLFFDFDHMVFAVADGTERFPWASRDLLKRLSETLSRIGAPVTAQGWKDLINGEVYSGQKYQHKTTFSCVAMRSDRGGVDMVISSDRQGHEFRRQKQGDRRGIGAPHDRPQQPRCHFD
jgi:hypothetical protein